MSVTKKFYNEYMAQRGSYCLVPNEIWELDSIDHTAKVIWCYILSRKQDWDSSRNNISRNLKIHKNSVSKYIKELETNNLLKTTKGPRGSLSFEIVVPSHWAITSTDTNNELVKLSSTTGANFDPVVVQNQTHTQEEISKTNCDNFINSQEARDATPEDTESVQRTESSSQVPVNNINPKSVLMAWRRKYSPGPGFLSGKKAEPALKELFFNLHKYGFEKDVVSTNQIIQLVFGVKPKPSLKTWIQNIESQIEQQRSMQYENSVVIDEVSVGEDLSQLINAEAIAKYNQYKAQGRTPADFNGMSLIDYANMRAYAESFSTVTMDKQ